MSCQECESAQFQAQYVQPVPEYYVRAGNGNVQLIGCSDHVRLVIKAYRAGLHIVENE